MTEAAKAHDVSLYAVLIKEDIAHVVAPMEKALFEPVMKGRRERAPDEEEIRRRFEQLAKTLPDKHKQIFQPYFQRYLSSELKKLS